MLNIKDHSKTHVRLENWQMFLVALPFVSAFSKKSYVYEIE